MDKFINLKLLNIPNFLLVMFSISLAIILTHLIISGGNQGNQ